MEKKNTLLLTVIAIATLLVAVVGATFAYFATTINNEGSLNVTAVTDPAASMFIASGETLELEITSENMVKNLTNSNVAAQDTKNLTVIYGSSKEDYSTKCTYDIVFTWTDAEDSAKYLFGEETHPTIRTDSADNKSWYEADGGKEFTIKVGDATVTGDGANGAAGNTTSTGMSAEKNIAYEGSCANNSYTSNEECVDNSAVWTVSENQMLLVKDAVIVANEPYAAGSCTTGQSDENDCRANGGDWTPATGTTVVWPVTISFYNLNVNQNHLADSQYVGKVEVVNVRC